MQNLTFSDHIAACEYMGEENPKFAAWQEGPHIGAFRISYVEAHKAHAKALESGDTDAIDSAWGTYCEAQKAWVIAYYVGAEE
jgi:hypothetical protein